MGSKGSDPLAPLSDDLGMIRILLEVIRDKSYGLRFFKKETPGMPGLYSLIGETWCDTMALDTMALYCLLVKA